MGHILLVDDNASVRTSVRRMLSADGYDAREADSGRAAIAGMLAARPALVLLDVSMRGESGFDVLRAVRADGSLAGIPIVMLSADDDPPTQQAAEALGARGWLIKGADWPASLMRIVRQFVTPPPTVDGDPPAAPQVA
jgi:CheY-like chemotaxis protein